MAVTSHLTAAHRATWPTWTELSGSANTDNYLLVHSGLLSVLHLDTLANTNHANGLRLLSNVFALKSTTNLGT